MVPRVLSTLLCFYVIVFLVLAGGMTIIIASDDPFYAFPIYMPTAVLTLMALVLFATTCTIRYSDGGTQNNTGDDYNADVEAGNAVELGEYTELPPSYATKDSWGLLYMPVAYPVMGYAPIPTLSQPQLVAVDTEDVPSDQLVFIPHLVGSVVVEKTNVVAVSQ